MQTIKKKKKKRKTKFTPGHEIFKMCEGIEIFTLSQ